MVVLLYFAFVAAFLSATTNAFHGSDCGRHPGYRALLHSLDHNPCMSDHEVWGRILNVSDSCRHEAFQKLYDRFRHDWVPAQCVCSGGYSTWNFVYNVHNMVCPTYLTSLLHNYNHGAPSCRTHHFIWNYLRNLPTNTFTPANNQHYDRRCLNQIISTLSTAMHISRSTCTCTRNQQAVQTTTVAPNGYCHATMDCHDLRCSSAAHAVCMNHVCRCQPLMTRTCHNVTIDCRHYPQCAHGNQYACAHGICRCTPSLTTTVPATTHGTPTTCHTRTDCNHIFCQRGHYPVCTHHSHRCICDSTVNSVCRDPITDCHYQQCPHGYQHTCVNQRCACTTITAVCHNPKTDCYFLNCYFNHQPACMNSKCQCVQTPTIAAPTTKAPHSEVCHNPAVDCQHEICSHGYHKTCVARVCTCLMDPKTTTITTTKKPTTPAPIKRNCDVLKVLSGVAHNEAIGRNGCPDGQHSPVVFFVQTSCNRIGANWNSWKMGRRVTAICSTLPHYTAIAHFKGRSFDKQYKTSNAGVFIGCSKDHFKMVTEDCHTNLHVKHIEFSNPDSAHYHVIQQQ